MQRERISRSNRTVIHAACFFAAALGGLLPSRLPAADGLSNPFYALDNSFQRPELTPDQQFDLLKQLGYAVVAWHEASPERVKADVAAIEKHGLKMLAVYCAPSVTPEGDLTHSPQLPAVIKMLGDHGS